MGYRPGEWLELRNHLSNSGFEYIGKESNQLMSEGHMSPDSVISTTKGRFLDAGEISLKVVNVSLVMVLGILQAENGKI